MNTNGTEIVVLIGMQETLTQLKAFDKKAVSRFNRLVNSELTKVQEEARALVPAIRPMSGWRTTAPTVSGDVSRNGKSRMPAWNSSEVAFGIVKSRAQQKVRRDYTTSAGAILNTSAAGKVFESAGYSTKHRRSTMSEGDRSSKQFKQTLRNRFDHASRLTWRAVFNNKPRIERDVKAAFEQLQAELQRHLNSQSTK